MSRLTKGFYAHAQAPHRAAGRLRHPATAAHHEAEERERAPFSRGDALLKAAGENMALFASTLARVDSAMRAGLVSRLQRVVGNAAIQRALAGASAAAAIPPAAMLDEGKTGTEPLGQPQPQPLPLQAEGGGATPLGRSPWGDIDGGLVSDNKPKAFVDGGKTGAAVVHWAGGGGGRGNEGVGTIQQLVAPVYEGRDGQPANAQGQGAKPAKAWIKPGTGKIKVKRSYKGVVVGANGSYYITRRAMRRIDVHEEKHVSSTKSIYRTHLKPLERRVSRRRGRRSGLSAGNTRDEAIAQLRAEIDWNDAIMDFENQDTTENIPMGTVDTTELAQADFYFDYGPRTVKGANYDHYVDTPPGP